MRVLLQAGVLGGTGESRVRCRCPAHRPVRGRRHSRTTAHPAAPAPCPRLWQIITEELNGAARAVLQELAALEWLEKVQKKLLGGGGSANPRGSWDCPRQQSSCYGSSDKTPKALKRHNCSLKEASAAAGWSAVGAHGSGVPASQACRHTMHVVLHAGLTVLTPSR